MAEPAIKTKLDALGVVIVGSTPKRCDPSQGRDDKLGSGHQSRQHQGQRVRPTGAAAIV